ncbi:hypothetical protein QTP88_024027 [Uroleucon formosanum]
MSIGAYRSSPIPSIYNLACTPPLEIRRLKITLNHELKLASTLPSLDFNPKFKTLSILLQENNLVISNLLTISPPLAPQWTNPNVTNTELSILRKKDTSSSIYKQEYFHLIHNIKCEKMYTDASKNQIGVGAAVVWNNTEFMYKLPDSCSVFTAESIAIIKALELITVHQIQDTIIFTDSLSAINNIKNTNNPSDIGLYIQNKIYTLKKINNFKIKLFWIPGHSNIIENERADLAAKTAISSSLSSPTYIISFRDIQAIITNKCHLRWHQKWLSLSTKLNQIKHNTDNWTFPIETPRKFEEEPPTCPTCGVKITIKHILTECRTYLNIRSSLNLPESLAEILHNHPKAIADIMQFITSANLQSKI